MMKTSSYYSSYCLLLATLTISGRILVHGQGSGDDDSGGTDCPFSAAFATSEGVTFPCSLSDCPTPVGASVDTDCCSAVVSYCRYRLGTTPAHTMLFACLD